MRIIEWFKRVWAAEQQKMQKGGLNAMPPTIPRPSKPPCGQGLSTPEQMLNQLVRQVSQAAERKKR